MIKRNHQIKISICQAAPNNVLIIYLIHQLTVLSVRCQKVFRVLEISLVLLFHIINKTLIHSVCYLWPKKTAIFTSETLQPENNSYLYLTNVCNNLSIIPIVAENPYSSRAVEKLPELIFFAEISSCCEFVLVLIIQYKSHIMWNEVNWWVDFTFQASFYAMPSVLRHRKLDVALYLFDLQKVIKVFWEPIC